MSSEIDDKSFIRTFGMVLGVLVVLAIVFAVMANMVGGGSDEDAAGQEIAKKAIADRLAPIASVAVAGKSADDATPAAPKSGADVVTAACAACHATGVANAPKIGDNAAWQPRFDAGMDVLINSALNGKGAAMPARGGNPTLSDDEIKAAVVQMLKDSGIDTEAAPTPAAAPVAAPAMEAPAMEAPTAAETAPVAEVPAAAAEPDLAKGEAVYKSSCFACHGLGVAGAPKVGDVNAWSARIAQGMDTLVQHANAGFAGTTGFMPAKGGNASIPDADVAAAVAFMVKESQ